jgi:alpha-glucosidase
MEITDYGCMIPGDKYNLHILFYSENIVRFVYCENKIVPGSTPAVTARPVKLEKCTENNIFYAGSLKIEVDRQSLAVKIYDQAGVLFSEDLKLDPAGPSLQKKLLWETGIYGNGEKYSWLNQLGTKTENYNSDVLLLNELHNPLIKELHTAIPFYIGVAPGIAYGIYFDNSHRTAFDFAADNPAVISFEATGGILDYYYIHGPSIADVTERYSLLTGTPPMPRKKFLGYQQSRYSYGSREELLEIARQMRRNKVPGDVLYLDIDYLDAYKVFTINKEKFRDFKEMLLELKQIGFAVVVIVNPGVKVEEGYRVYREGVEKDCFVQMPGGEVYVGEVWPKPAVFPDFFQPEVRKWWGTFHKELLELGVEGIWNDMNEPADFTRETGTLPDQALHKTDQGAIINHAEGHNLYGLMQTRATREALENYQPDKRPFILTRAAFAGSQRYAALWTGDNASIWEHLEISIPMLLNLGLSGFSFVGADVGGYRGDCSGELLVRWTQAGAFIPFFRNHSETGTAYQEPWRYPEKELDIMRNYIRLRYRFLSYFYNLMRESALSGRPAIRPLLYHYQDDRQVYHINDQFLLGEAVMVCPVLRPGATHRLVYLPAGLWHDFWSGEVHGGGRHIVRETPLDIIPLYVKAGSILPLDKWQAEDVSCSGQASLEMHCYAGQEGSYRLYIDDGESYNYRQGEYSEVEFSMTGDPVNPGVTFTAVREDYPLPEIKLVIHPIEE